jgi:hypothetical protein
LRHDIFVLHRCFIFRRFTIVKFLPRCHRFRACGKIVYFYRDVIFGRATIFLISPSCLLLSLHNTFDFTAMPSFVAPRYL